MDDLRQIGVVNAYNLVKSNRCNAILNLLWALEGALRGVRWTRIPETAKRQLKIRIKGPT